MTGVFVNYRVAEETMGAAVIHETLARKFGDEHVFRDCNSIQAGEYYPEALRSGLARSGILLVVLGPRWISLRDATGIRLIDRKRDWVRWEIEQALDREMSVIPVLLKIGKDDPVMPTTDQLPASIRGLALRQAYVVDQACLGTDLDTLATHLVGLAPELVIPRLFTPPPPARTADSAPSTLLRQEYGVVPFTGRADQVADLRSWALGSAACSARLVVGPSGCGKTRLARALCDDLTDAGWLAGIVHGQAPAAQIRHTAGIDKPLLAVIDDVETSSDQLVALAMAVGERAVLRDAPVRLLLLGRSAGDWLRGVRGHKDQRVRNLFGPIDRQSMVTMTTTDQQVQFAAAASAFAAELGRPVPVTSLPDNADELVGVHATALATVRGGHDPRPSDPLSRLLRMDRVHFRRLARADNATHLDPAVLAAVGTVATLCRPASQEQADSLLARLPAMIGPVDDYVRWLGRLYPGTYPLSPIRPKLLGERLVATTLTERPALAIAVATHGTDQQVTNALGVLGSALRTYPALCDVLRDMVSVDPRRLVSIGVGITAGLPDPEPFARVLGGVFTDTDMSVDGIWQFMARLGAERGRSADPVRATTMDAWMRSWTDIVRRSMPAESAPPPPLANIVDGLTGLVTNFAKAWLDPSANAMPKRPDGGDIVARELLDILRTLMEPEPPPDDV